MAYRGKWPAQNFSNDYYQDGSNNASRRDSGLGSSQPQTPSSVGIDAAWDSDGSGQRSRRSQRLQDRLHRALDSPRPPCKCVPKPSSAGSQQHRLATSDADTRRTRKDPTETITPQPGSHTTPPSQRQRPGTPISSGLFGVQQSAQADRALLNNFEEVEQLIQEEGDDVQIALRLQNQRAASHQATERTCLTELSGSKLNATLRRSICQNEEYDESDDEVSPEVAAAMMHSEEQGILMGAAPSRVFNALFVDDEKDLIVVASAAPFQPQSVVVPVSVDDMPYTSSAEDLVALASTIRGKEPLPGSSVFSDTMKQRGGYSTVLEETSKPYIMEPNEAMGSSEDTSRTSLPCGGTIEYVLEAASPPDHFSRIQLRGSTSPEWFPGFFQALPSIKGITAVCRDPGPVLEEAWLTLQSTLA